MAATLTQIVTTPYSIKLAYAAAGNTGNAVTLTAAQLIALLAKGPLWAYLTNTQTAPTWQALEAGRKISVYATPASGGAQFDGCGFFAGPNRFAAQAADTCSVIIEIRFDHSVTGTSKAV